MKPIFIGGCPRSGTTLLGALLGAHSRCVCVPEMPFKIYPLHRAEWEPGGLSRAEFADLLQHHSYFQNWGIPARALAGRAGPAKQFTYRAAVTELVGRYAAAVEQPESDVWVDHTPENVLHVGTLLEQFPDAVFLHIVRDGRGVAASLLPLRWSVNSVFGAAAVWAEHLGYGLAAEAAQPARVHRVGYEELVREPKRVLARICEFAGLPVEEQLGTQTRFRVPPATRHQHPLVSRPPDPTRADAWRNTLSQRQIEIFESIAGDLLAHLGYPLVFAGRAAPADKREKVNATFTDSLGGLQRLGWRTLNGLKGRLHLRPSQSV